MTYQSNEPFDYSLELAKGNIQGHSGIFKFGANDTITDGSSEDIWDGGGLYSFPVTADMTHLRQVVDQVTMRGGKVSITGLDTNWDLVTQTVALDAIATTTPVVLTTALKRVHTMSVIEDIVTDQNIELRNVGGGTTYAIIQAGNNRTLMAVYTIPNGYTGFVTGYWCDTVESTGKEPKSTDFHMVAADRDNGYEFMVMHARATSKGGNTSIFHKFSPYITMTQKMDMRIEATPNGADAKVHAGFDMILVDNTYL